MKSWSSTQGTVALSSGEAEYYALVKALAEAIGMRSLARDLGWEMKLRVWVDSTAAKSIASRVGVGKVRHLEVRYLWVQEKLRAKEFTLKKIRGDRNPADVLTKPLGVSEVRPKIGFVGGHIMDRGGCGNDAPREKWADVNDDEDRALGEEEDWDEGELQQLLGIDE